MAIIHLQYSVGDMEIVVVMRYHHDRLTAALEIRQQRFIKIATKLWVLIGCTSSKTYTPLSSRHETTKARRLRCPVDN